MRDRSRGGGLLYLSEHPAGAAPGQCTPPTPPPPEVLLHESRSIALWQRRVCLFWGGGASEYRAGGALSIAVLHVLYRGCVRVSAASSSSARTTNQLIHAANPDCGKSRRRRRRRRRSRRVLRARISRLHTGAGAPLDRLTRSSYRHRYWWDIDTVRISTQRGY